MAFIVDGYDAAKTLENQKQLAFRNHRILLGWRLELIAINEAREKNLSLALPLILEEIIGEDLENIYEITTRDQHGTKLDVSLAVPKDRKLFFTGLEGEETVQQVNMYNSIAQFKTLETDIPELNRP